jgi:ubiquinone/menaquinone biosynthesis C-methylase UbiE
MTLLDFDTVAGEYDSFYESEYGKRIDFYEKIAVASQLTVSDGWKALEIGCGTGHWTSFFSEFGFNITAIDISEKMIQEAKTKKIKGVEFKQANVLDLPFEAGAFDHVFTIATLEFIEDRDSVMQEIKRVLKRGGSLLAGCLNQNSELGKNKEKDPVFKNAKFYFIYCFHFLKTLPFQKGNFGGFYPTFYH